MIILEDVTKTYSSGVPALNGINLHVQKGEFVFIVGYKAVWFSLALMAMFALSGVLLLIDTCRKHTER